MSIHTVKCRRTGFALAFALDGGICVCTDGICRIADEWKNEKKRLENEDTSTDDAS